MPPPTVKCSVCGEAVLKAQTVCIGMDGTHSVRCCKSHPEAAKAAGWQKQQEDKKAKEQDARARDQKAHGLSNGSCGIKPVCWCCLKDAISTQEMYMILLEESIRGQMEGRPFIETLDGTLAQRAKKRICDSGKIVVARFEGLTPQQMNLLWRTEMPLPFKRMMEMLHVADLCAACAAAVGLKYEPPPATPEQIKAAMAVLDSGLKQAIEDKIARNN